MTAPAPWRSQPPEGREDLKDLLDSARETPPFTTSDKARGWWRIAEAAQAPRRRRVFALTLAGAMALLLITAAGGWILRGRFGAHEDSWAMQKLPGGDELKIAQGTAYSLDPDKQTLSGIERIVRLSSGTLEANVLPRGAHETFAVITPDVTVTVSATRFLVMVANGETEIRVFEGEAHVRSASGEVVVKANEQLRSDDPRLHPQAIAAPKPDDRLLVKFHFPRASSTSAPKTSCDGEKAPGSRERCLEKASAGSGLAAQTALYALSLARAQAGEDARAELERYQATYPDGVFAPEVSLALIEDHARFGRTDAALAEADRFLTRFASDARAPDVAQWRKALSESMGK